MANVHGHCVHKICINWYQIMKGTILLNYDENVRQVEKEEQDRFLRDLLDQMGVPVDEFWTDGTPLTVESKIKLREILVANSIQVFDNLDGNMQIYVDGELVGEWFKSTYKLKRDLSQIDPRKQPYIEMQISFWTIFEEQQQ